MQDNATRLDAAFESGDLDQLLALLDERVVWRGLPDVEYRRQDGVDDDSTASRADGDDVTSGDRPEHEPGHVPMCSGRDEVRIVLEEVMASRTAGRPAIIAEAGDSLVVDARVDEALAFPLHQAVTFRGRRIVLIQDYANRSTAVADVLP